MTDSTGRQIQPRRAVVTLWFVSCDDPAAVLRAEPGPDRGFGRKYLAQLDPSLLANPFADFPLNRSTEVGPDEYYIGGYQGLAVVQHLVDDFTLPTDLPERLIEGVAADDIYVTAVDGTGFGAVAWFHDGEVRRAFTATPNLILQNTGLPTPAEGPYWAGEHKPIHAGDTAGGELFGRGVVLPFIPAELINAAVTEWLGFDPHGSGPDVPVAGFATDGRPEARIGAARPLAAGAGEPGAEIAVADDGYDDYEAADDSGPDAADRLRAAGRGAWLGLKAAGRVAARGARRLRESGQRRRRS